jgi:hypothetical protein
MMCLACQQDAMWFAYLDSRGLLTPEEKEEARSFFAGYPARSQSPSLEDAWSAPQPVEPEPAEKTTFSCDDPTASAADSSDQP